MAAKRYMKDIHACIDKLNKLIEKTGKTVYFDETELTVFYKDGGKLAEFEAPSKALHGIYRFIQFAKLFN